MFFVKRAKVDIEETCVNAVVTRYFQYLKEDRVVSSQITGKVISELLRLSVCKICGLETKGYSNELEVLSISLSNVLTPLLNAYGIIDSDESVKKGFLEACVHCMEMSRRRAGL